MALQTAIIGNSLLRDVDLSSFDLVRISTGLGMSALVSRFLQDFPDSKDLLLYVVEGPLRYTTKVNEGRRMEVIRKGEICDIVEEMDSIKRRLSSKRIKVIFPTMSSISFKAYNNHLLHSHRTRTLLWRHRYQNWQHLMEQKLKVDNGRIVRNNRENDIHTPFLNKRVVVSVKGRTKFRYSPLRDGLHPGQQLKEVWSRELAYNRALNLARLSRNL